MATWPWLVSGASCVQFCGPLSPGRAGQVILQLGPTASYTPQSAAPGGLPCATTSPWHWLCWWEPWKVAPHWGRSRSWTTTHSWGPGPAPLHLASVSSLEGQVPAQRGCVLGSVSASGHHLIKGTGQRRCLSLGEEVCLKLQRWGGAQCSGLGWGRGAAGTESGSPAPYLLPA